MLCGLYDEQEDLGCSNGLFWPSDLGAKDQAFSRRYTLSCMWVLHFPGLMLHGAAVPQWCWRLLGQGNEKSQQYRLCTEQGCFCPMQVCWLPLEVVSTHKLFSSCPSYFLCFILSLSVSSLPPLSWLSSSSLLNHPTLRSGMPFPSLGYPTLLLCPTTSLSYFCLTFPGEQKV